MTNPSTNAHNAQTQNTSSEYLAIDFTHRRPPCAKKIGTLGLADSVNHFATRAKSVLTTLQHQLEDDNSYYSVDVAISEIEDIQAVVDAHHEHIKAQSEMIRPYLAEHLNTNPQT